MQFVWDEKKNRLNLAKRKISFETAMLVSDDLRAVSRPDRVAAEEERWQTLGLADGMVVLLVAHTWREEHGEEVIRIISDRKATPHEKRIHEENF